MTAGCCQESDEYRHAGCESCDYDRVTDSCQHNSMKQTLLGSSEPDVNAVKRRGKSNGEANTIDCLSQVL